MQIERVNSPTPRRRDRGARGREDIHFQRPDLTPDRKPPPPSPSKETPQHNRPPSFSETPSQTHQNRTAVVRT
ncbi:hypothetical protein HID58_034323 [Brassica napus]|uniref:Uncharacterized protein n=1 Tax=Brassica napus TaxID=3708 RepID=A0ABQ8C2Q4_BRANA|nr:hypothetical protein HID58_034323 [Brassica napus]